MGVLKALVKLSSLSSNSNLRLCFSKESPKTSRKLVKLLDCLSLFESGGRPKGGIVYIEDEDVAISLGGEQIGKDGRVNLAKMPVVPLGFYHSAKKGKVKQNDILVCKDGALTGKCCIVNYTFPNDSVMVNEHAYIFRSNETYLQQFLYYLIRDDHTQFQIKDLAYRKKGQPGLNTDHLSLMKVPYFSLSEQKDILDKTQQYELEISKLYKLKSEPLKIINQVFGKALGFDWEEFENAKKIKVYTSAISKFSNNIDCRMGIRFHNKAGVYLQNFLESITKKRVKNFISEPIVLGSSISPIDYDEEGESYYIAMSGIKSYAFDPKGCKKVSEEYASNNLNKTVRKGDILLARSGEGTIGKVALIEEEEINGIFADFTQRIRLTGFDHLCAYYYFRSDFFQYLVYSHKKGLGNNTNIFPSQIKEFPIPDWDEVQQTKIVKIIKKQLDEQQEIDRLIREKQQSINKILEDAIKL
jgi:type I restriction enzyme S subunit